MTHPWVMDNIVQNIILIKNGSGGVMVQARILGMCVLWPWPWRYDLWSRSWHALRSWTIVVWNIIQIQYGSEDVLPGHNFWVCVHFDLDLRDLTLGQGHDTPLGHEQQLCKILSRSKKSVRSYGFSMEFWYVCTVTLTLGQGHDTSLGDGQQLCEILSRSNMVVRSYGPDTDFGYLCTVTLTLEICPWVMDNNRVKNYPDRSME